MPSYSITKALNYESSQLYNLVADIENYPEFIPWCDAARILDKKQDITPLSGSALNREIIIAELLINFKGVRGKYISRVLLDKSDNGVSKISVELAEGPFHHLTQSWKFIPTDSKTTIVEFDIDFKMRSHMIERIINLMFENLCSKMITAFEKRADYLYRQNNL